MKSPVQAAAGLGVVALFFGGPLLFFGLGSALNAVL